MLAQGKGGRVKKLGMVIGYGNVGVVIRKTGCGHREKWAWFGH